MATFPNYADEQRKAKEAEEGKEEEARLRKEQSLSRDYEFALTVDNAISTLLSKFAFERYDIANVETKLQQLSLVKRNGKWVIDHKNPRSEMFWGWRLSESHLAELSQLSQLAVFVTAQVHATIHLSYVGDKDYRSELEMITEALASSLNVPCCITIYWTSDDYTYSDSTFYTVPYSEEVARRTRWWRRIFG